VTFRYRDTETGAEKRCALDAEAFIHRFLQHGLPKSFVKVRYYGFFAPTLRARLTALRDSLLPVADLIAQPTPPQTAPSPGSPHLLPHSILCPPCGQPMLFLHTLAPRLCRSP
jgi:putative transposase